MLLGDRTGAWVVGSETRCDDGCSLGQRGHVPSLSCQSTLDGCRQERGWSGPMGSWRGALCTPISQVSVTGTSCQCQTLLHPTLC